MKDFKYDEWVKFVEDSYKKMKGEIKDLYSVKDSLDGEVSTLFVEKVSNFYNQFYSLYDLYSSKTEKTELDSILFASDIEKVIQAYADLIRFKSVLEDLMDRKVLYPAVFLEVGEDFKQRYLKCCSNLNDISKWEVVARFQNKDLLDSVKALDSIFKDYDQSKHFIYNAPYLYLVYRSLKQLEEVVLEDLIKKEHGPEIE